MSIFTAEELKELAEADAIIDATFVETLDEIKASRLREQKIRISRMTETERIAYGKRQEYDRLHAEQIRIQKRENARLYRAAHPDRTKATKARWYRENRDRVREQHRQYRARKRAEDGGNHAAGRTGSK